MTLVTASALIIQVWEAMQQQKRTNSESGCHAMHSLPGGTGRFGPWAKWWNMVGTSGVHIGINVAQWQAFFVSGLGVSCVCLDVSIAHPSPPFGPAHGAGKCTNSRLTFSPTTC